MVTLELVYWLEPITSHMKSCACMTTFLFWTEFRHFSSWWDLRIRCWLVSLYHRQLLQLKYFATRHNTEKNVSFSVFGRGIITTPTTYTTDQLSNPQKNRRIKALSVNIITIWLLVASTTPQLQCMLLVVYSYTLYHLPSMMTLCFLALLLWRHHRESYLSPLAFPPACWCCI